VQSEVSHLSDHHQFCRQKKSGVVHRPDQSFFLVANGVSYLKYALPLSLSTSVNNMTTPDCGIFQQKILGSQQASDGGSLQNGIKPTKASDTILYFGVQSLIFSPR
jgi:hypothetical protein